MMLSEIVETVLNFTLIPLREGCGSLEVNVELSVFWGLGVRVHAQTPKYGSPLRKFLKTHGCSIPHAII